jgi:hypothetical protein
MILQAFEPVLHLGDAAFEAGRERLIRKCRTHDRCDDFVQVGQAVDCVSQGLFVDLRVVRTDSVAD